MASHYVHEFAPPNLNAHLQTALVGGWIGVDLFFVISGFLITALLLEARGKEGYFRNFYARRFLRIFPLFYAVLAVRFFVLPLLGEPLPPHVAQNAPMYWLYASNFVHGAADASDPFDLIDVSWSLAVEEQFYLVWPFLVMLLPRNWIPRFLVAILGLGIVLRIVALMWGATLEELYFATPLRLDGLAVGALVAVAVRTPDWHVHLRRWAGPIFLIGSVLLIVLDIKTDGLRRTQISTETVGFLLVAIVFGALITLVVMARPGAPVVRALNFMPLRVVGVVSFGLYLIHQIVAAEVSRFIVDPQQPLGNFQPLLIFIIFVGIAAPLAFLVALVSWNVYESQWLKLKRFFVQPSVSGAKSGQTAPGRAAATAATTAAAD
jgi:peptidoglycan/LPS O-acetylase OafA/YrhL